MKFGLSLAQVNPSIWPQLTVAADTLGYESVWIPEHLVLPVEMAGSPHDGADHPPIPSDMPVFDALGYLCFLAGQTSNIRLGTQVYNIGLRHPFVTARAAATLDLVSGGRLDFGVGASWLKAEWDAIGQDFHTRGRRVDEALDVCTRLWRDQVIEHHGEFYDFDPVMFEPKPVQPGGPPLHIGGDSTAALRRVAAHGHGWIPMNHTLEQLPPSLARLRQLWDEAGRAGRPEITVATRIDSIADAKQAAEAGIDRVIVRPWRRTSDAMESIARYADEVVHQVG